MIFLLCRYIITFSSYLHFIHTYVGRKRASRCFICGVGQGAGGVINARIYSRYYSLIGCITTKNTTHFGIEELALFYSDTYHSYPAVDFFDSFPPFC